MQYIEAPNLEEFKFKTSIFLAGTISGAEKNDWQSKAAKAFEGLDITVINPRRKVYLHNDEVAQEQIEWEFERLHKVKIILFWFSFETVAPITLFELGAALTRKDWMKRNFYSYDNGQQRVYIGADLKYPRLLDLCIQSRLAGYEGYIYNDLDLMVGDIKKDLK